MTMLETFFPMPMPFFPFALRLPLPLAVGDSLFVGLVAIVLLVYKSAPPPGQEREENKTCLPVHNNQTRSYTAELRACEFFLLAVLYVGVVSFSRTFTSRYPPLVSWISIVENSGLTRVKGNSSSTGRARKASVVLRRYRRCRRRLSFEEYKTQVSSLPSRVTDKKQQIDRANLQASLGEQHGPTAIGQLCSMLRSREIAFCPITPEQAL